MNKSKILEYISKYTLGGIVESVTITVENKKATCNFVTDEKALVGKVECDNFEFEDGAYHIYDTNKIKQLLSVLDEEINVNLNKTKDKNLSILFSDKISEVVYVLSDETVIPKVPALKFLPEFDVQLNLDKEFINRFIKSKSALNEVDVFTLIMSPTTNKLQFVIGYSESINTNKITLAVNAQPGKDMVSKPISFNAKYFKEILTANNQCADSKFLVSTKGLASIEFKYDDFSSKYYLVEIQID